jgi:uncharacterized protein (DUF2267 family)
MVYATIDAFDITLQKTMIWFQKIMDEMGWDDQHKTYQILRCVLHTLRDRLPIQEAVDLGAQLPMLIRGMYYEGWNLKGKPIKMHTQEEFFTHVCQQLPASRCDFNPEQATRAIFKVLAESISAGEIQDIKDNMPKSLLDLWP